MTNDILTFKMEVNMSHFGKIFCFNVHIEMYSESCMAVKFVKENIIYKIQFQTAKVVRNLK